VLAGKTEEEAAASHPEYVEALRLYRAGLLNSYDIPSFEGKEDKRAFESRVACEVARILDHGNESLKVIVTHRSPITAALIDFARRYHGYPADFFGHVQLDLGRLSWVEEIENGRWRIRQVNARWRSMILPRQQ
jgi:broad specificity phosphatase PhoE